MKNIQEKNKSLGHIKSMKIKTDLPVKMDMDMEYNKIMLFCGTNGTGKSLVMKYNWALGTIASIMTNTHPMSPPLSKVAQEILDGTLEDQNINGELISRFENGTLKLTLENGKVQTSEFERGEGITTAPTPTFMSKVTRTFSQIHQYLQLEKELGMERMLKTYRLYDVLYIAKMKARLSEGLEASPELKNALDGFDMAKHDIQKFILDNETVFFLNTAGERKSMSTLSDGEQSIVNMCLAPSL